MFELNNKNNINNEEKIIKIFEKYAKKFLVDCENSKVVILDYLKQKFDKILSKLIQEKKDNFYKIHEINNFKVNI